MIIAVIALGGALGSALRLARTALQRLDALCQPGHVVEWPARVLST